jgi:hypothetical protein
MLMKQFLESRERPGGHPAKTAYTIIGILSKDTKHRRFRAGAASIRAILC